LDARAAVSFADGLRALRDEGFLIPGAEAMIPAVGQAILAELPAAQRRRLHEAVARALVAAGTDVVAAATQLRAARAFIPAAAGVYRAVADRVRFADPAAALGWYDDAVDAGAAPAEVAAGRAEAAALLGMPVDSGQPVGSADAGRLALVDGAIEAHQGRSDRSAQALVDARPPGPTLAVPALVATGRLAEATTPEALAARATTNRVTAAAAAAPQASTAGGNLGERLDDAAASQGVAGLRRLAEGALVAAADPAASVSLLIEAAEALERTPPAVVLPDTAHALGALMASVSGDVASAEYLLDRALTTGAGGPVAVQRHRLLLAWVRMRAGRYDTAVAELARLSQAELSGRDRFLLVAISAGVARRSGDVARLRDAWIAVEPVLARRAVDLFGVEAVEELAVAATRLRRYARVAPVLDALDRIVAALGQPPAWAVAVGWIRMQVAIADEDAGAAAAVAARMASAGGAAGAARPKAQYAAAGLWARVLAGDVDAGAVLAVAEELVAVELPWEASRLVGQAAIRTSDPGTARRLLERARELSSAEVSTDRRTETQHGGLSEREVEVARMVLAGDTYREIGGRLFISPKTVEHHVARIRNKLGASTRAEFLAALRDTLRDGPEATDQP
jgi:DNA-binding CsgD family transcriptional regulator